MISIGMAAATATDLRQLEPGQLFLYEADGLHAIAVAMRQEGAFAPWLTLRGDAAFQLRVLERAHQQLRVLALGIDANGLTLKIDPSHVASKNSEYQVGQLIFPTEGVASIAAEWPEHRGKGYNNVVTLGKWEHSQDQPPSFRVGKWALGFADQAGHWVDVVKRDPPL